MSELDPPVATNPDLRLSSSGHGAWVVRLCDRTPSEVRWLWPGRIAIGKITLLSGDPGLGKSLVTLDLAARVSRGAAMPEAVGPPSRGGQSDQNAMGQSAARLAAPTSSAARLAAPTAPGSVVLLSAEDDVDDTIVPRLVAAGADLGRIVIPDATCLRRASRGRERHALVDLKTDLDVLESVLADVPDCRLLVVDPVSAYCGNVDAHRNADVRALLAPLAALAARRGVAVVAVNHLNKSNQGPIIYRSMGSMAFAAAARNVLGVVADPKNAAGRLCLSVKSNLHVPPPGLRFTIEQVVVTRSFDESQNMYCGSGLGPRSASETPPTNLLPRVVWQTEPVDYSAEEAAAEIERAPASSGLVEACEWLQGVLAGGPVASTEIKRLATEESIAHRTLWRAKERLGVVATRLGRAGPGSSFVWQLPEVDNDAGRGMEGAG